MDVTWTSATPAHRPGTMAEVFRAINTYVPRCECHVDVPTEEHIRDGLAWLDVVYCPRADGPVIAPFLTDKGNEKVRPFAERFISESRAIVDAAKLSDFAPTTFGQATLTDDSIHNRSRIIRPVSAPIADVEAAYAEMEMRSDELSKALVRIGDETVDGVVTSTWKIAGPRIFYVEVTYVDGTHEIWEDNAMPSEQSIEDWATELVTNLRLDGREVAEVAPCTRSD